MQLSFQKDRFVVKCSYLERLKVRSAGFYWDSVAKEWWTKNPRNASKLSFCADSEATRRLQVLTISVAPWTGPIRYPSDLVLRGFQRRAVEWALSRNRSYLALDPGLGKTIVAAVIRSTLQASVVYVCPPYLMENVKEEFDKWKPGIEHTFIHGGRVMPAQYFLGGVKDSSTAVFSTMIVSDAIISRKETQKVIREFREVTEMFGPVILIADESHRFKNLDAARTKALFRSLVPQFEKAILMSGTPVPNRPFELWPALNFCAPEAIDYIGRFDYGRKYCAGFESGYGWDFTGASNTEELARRITEKFMLRIRKVDALPELPPKTEELVLIDEDLPAAVRDFDAKILRNFSPDDTVQEQIEQLLSIENWEALHIATYRRELGVLKAPHAIRYILTLLSETDEALLVFAHHKEVVATLTSGLAKFKPITITGDTPVAKRQGMVREFQENGDRRLFIGNIQAAGTGFNLTKATRVVFAEYSWVPGENDQASDRAHRIGQKDHVFVQYLVYRNSLDRKVLETLWRKREITSTL